MAHDADRQSSWLCPRCRRPLRPTGDKFSCYSCVGNWTRDELARTVGGKRGSLRRRTEPKLSAVVLSSDKASRRERMVVLGLALGIHVVVGIVAMLADWWQLGDDFFFGDHDPHPLDRWEYPAVIVWCIVAVVILLLTFWSIPRRHVVQLLLPVAALGIWLAAIGLVGPYPVTLHGEVNNSGLTIAPTALKPGWQSIVLRNATSNHQRVGVVVSDEVFDPGALTDGTDPDQVSSDPIAWFWLKPRRCDFGICSLPAREIAPSAEIRHAVMLHPGTYALVCARTDTITVNDLKTVLIVIDRRCQPVFFTVEAARTSTGVDTS